MAPKIPARWLDYKPVGEIIKGTRFIAFKVPLMENVVTAVPSDIRLDCGSLVDKIPDLGMIIDLTNTYRYYDPRIFQEQGLVHEKIMIPGRELPQRQYVERFNMVVKNFLQANANNGKLIGVHCTHGVNRTGYLLSNFMISELQMNPEEAIKCVEEARGHPIERENYRSYLLDVAASRSYNHDSRRHYNNVPTNHNTWRRNDNNRSQMGSNNHHPRDNWRIPQSYSNNIAENSSASGSRKSYYYARGERQNYSDNSSYRRKERQYSQNSNSYDRDYNAAPFERSIPESRYNNSKRGSKQSGSYGRDKTRSLPDRSSYDRTPR